ncbi:MAG: histidine--tRNA ligase [Chitinispirillia bacterium]|jgi:histidyl-tRNA synthetase
MQTFVPPKGTRDCYPDDMVIRDHIFNSWEKTCRRYGFEKYEGPIFEHLELYTQKSGEEIEKQLYTLVDKSGRELALRPEMTPSLARMVAAKGSSLKLPVRWYSIPRLFRYEKMQRGRTREFFQLNMDILGISQPTADAELMALSIDTMRDLGLTDRDFSIHISSRTLLEELFLFSGVKAEKLPMLYSLLDKQHKMSESDFNALLSEIIPGKDINTAIAKILGIKSLDEIRRINDSLEALAGLDTVFNLLDSYGMSDFAEFDIGIVRGLAYYTGIVWELIDKNRSLRSIAGGGRYNQLVKLYGGMDTPAVGLAIGDVVLTELLTEKGLLPNMPPRSDVFIVTFDKKSHKHTVLTAQKLRNSGISCEFALKPAGIGKQMKQADAARAKIVVFIGGEEEEEGRLKIRDMKTGEERQIEKRDIAAAIQKQLDM